MPKCSVLYSNSMDVYNQSHPGFPLEFLDEEGQIEAAEIFVQRLVTIHKLHKTAMMITEYSSLVAFVAHLTWISDSTKLSILPPTSFADIV